MAAATEAEAGILHPWWAAYPGAFTADECARLIAALEHGPTRTAGLVDGKAEDAIRRTVLHWLAETPDTAWVYDRLARLVARGNREVFGFTLGGFDEEAQVARYDCGAYYDWHIDRGGRGLGRSRKLTVAVQLSPPAAYDGGGLDLNPDGRPVTAPRDQGTALVFPAFTLHRVAPVTRGSRYSLVIWTHGPDFV